MKPETLASMIGAVSLGGDAVEDCNSVFEPRSSRHDPARGPYVQLLTGTCWYVFDPQPQDVHFGDLQALSRVSRYGGHTLGSKHAYSVAEHLVRCARAARNDGHSDRIVLACLLHDAHEAYQPGDLPAPAKRGDHPFAVAARALEKQVQNAVLYALTGDPAFCTGSTVKHYDMVMLATERRDLMVPSWIDWGPLPRPLPETIWPWTAEEAWRRWVAEFEKLSASVLQRAA